jgi:hypothetical protein
MAEAGREHVLRHHTHRNICEYILQQIAGHRALPNRE